VLHNSRRTATRIFVLESDIVLIPAQLPSVTFTILSHILIYIKGPRALNSTKRLR